MSGGSFDYLCFADLTSEHLKTIERMGAELEALGAQRAVMRTDGIAAKLRAIEIMQEDVRRAQSELEPLWKAVEWWRSGDTNRESVLAAIEAWNAKEAARRG